MSAAFLLFLGLHWEKTTDKRVGLTVSVLVSNHGQLRVGSCQKGLDEIHVWFGFHTDRAGIHVYDGTFNSERSCKSAIEKAIAHRLETPWGE